MRSSPLLPLLLLASILGCSDDRTRAVLPKGLRVDAHPQTAAKQVDVLWVIDNSGSMAPRQENLARNITTFIERFARSQVDFRLAVTTTDVFRDDGQLKGNPVVLTPETPALIATFGRTVRDLGTHGSPYEAGLQAGRRALERILETNAPVMDAMARCQNACAPGTGLMSCRDACIDAHPVAFLRPNASLFLVFVTDEEDRSEADVRGYYRFYETVKGLGNDGLVSTAAIMGDVPTNSCGATPGTRYAQLSSLTGGAVGSICDPEFANSLERLADTAVNLQRKFGVGGTPKLETLEVYVRFRCDAPETNLSACTEIEAKGCTGDNPEALNRVCKVRQGAPDGWVYEPGDHVVYFDGTSVPNVPSQVELHYLGEERP